MADSEKVDFSTGKGKEKTSLLDNDISKDFLSSWKSMSMTGGGDMDFNFEPVTKGNKKSFDFGKLDMDFSLDAEFGKMSSFKIDVPDLDFSSSPKKSTKSKEKSENESGTGNRRSKNDEFTFSFDFNGMDDFSLDAPSRKTEGAKSPDREKSSKEIGSTKEIEREDSPRQVADNIGKAIKNTTTKTPLVYEDAANSNSEDLMDGKGNLDGSSGNCSSMKKLDASNSAMEVDLLQTKVTHTSPKKKLSGNTQKTDHLSHVAEKTSFKNSYAQGTAYEVDSIPERSPSRSTSLPAPIELADAKVSSVTKETMTSKGSDEEIQIEKANFKQSYTELKEKDISAKSLLVKTSTQSTVSEETEVCSLSEKQNDGSYEACNLPGKLSAAAVFTPDPAKLKPDESSTQCSTDQMINGCKENEIGDVGSSGSGKLTRDIIDPSAANFPERLPCETRCNAETQRSALKVSSSPFGSGSTLAKPTPMAHKVPGSYNFKFSMIRDTNDGGRTKLSIMERKNKGSTHLRAEDRSSASNKDNAKKLDGNLNSCTKELVNCDSVSESTVKNSDGDTVSREGDNNMNQKVGNEMGVHDVPHDGRAMKDRLLMVGSEKNIHDVKSSGFHNPLGAQPGKESKFSNQDNPKFNERNSSIVSIQKSNTSELNKLPPLTIGKKLPVLPSSMISKNATTNKLSVSPVVEENAKSVRTFKSTLQGLRKIDSPIISEKQNPSTPSLKRKPSKAADEGPEKLHPLKRLSPSENRMSEGLSARETKDEVHTKGTLVQGSGKNVAGDYMTSKFDFHQDANMEDMSFTLMLESDANVEKAEACAKELEDICNMLKKKHEEAKEILVRALVNNNNLLMLNHPIYDEKIRGVQRFADRLMSKEMKTGA